MAKLNREGRLRDKRAEKEARKAARKLAPMDDAAQAPSDSDVAVAGGVQQEEPRPA